MTNTLNRKSKLNKRLFWFVFPVTIILYEFILKISIFGFVFDDSILFTVLFSVAAGMLLTAIVTLFKPKIGNIITIVALLALLLLFGSQFVYFQIFRKFYIVSSIQGAGEAINKFTTSTIKGIVVSIPFILLFLLPLVIYKKKA